MDIMYIIPDGIIFVFFILVKLLIPEPGFLEGICIGLTIGFTALGIFKLVKKMNASRNES